MMNIQAHSLPLKGLGVPQFLRLGDRAEQTTLTWSETTGQEETREQLPPAHFEEDFPIPILLSPSDRVALQSGTERLYEQETSQSFENFQSLQPLLSNH